MFPCQKSFIFSPPAGIDWAEKMVLNPAVIPDSQNPQVWHMLFRATGPWPRAQVAGKPLPYPIFIGYGVSRDAGKNWEFDLSRPAMQPRLEYDRERFEAHSCRDGRVYDFANGCMEDPRLFPFEGDLYLSVACRAFPPGPYWEHDDPVQCMPEWARDCPDSAVRENATVTLLYRVDLKKLAARDYDHSFEFIAPLHAPEYGDDRDAMLFPRRLVIGGQAKIACLHRPKNPAAYPEGKHCSAPSIFLALADEITDFAAGRAEEYLFAEPRFPWEADRIGASWAPLEIAPGKWLLPYHGKQDAQVGYTQSFMILRENGACVPDIAARPSERMLFASEPWELGGDFGTPCLFSCSGFVSDGILTMGYGAADAKVGLVRMDWHGLLKYLDERER